MRRRLLRFMLTIALLAVALAGYAFLEARRDPVVRRATIALPLWPAGSPPLRVVLLSDLHAGNLSTGVDRLTRIIAQVNSLRPDLVLIAGDFLPGHNPISGARARLTLRPLAGLHARLGVVAAPGNHDHWTGRTAAARDRHD